MTRGGANFPVYLATGDSLTGGYWTSLANGTKRFAYLVSQSLAGRGFGGTFATHPNPGMGIDMAINSIKSSLIRYEPQIVTVEWGINNINALLSASEFQEKYSTLLDIILEETRRIVVCCNIPWFGYEVGSIYYDLSLQYNTAIAAEAASRGLPLADCWTPMVGDLDLMSRSFVTYLYPSTHFGDWQHPNDVGHQVIADAIWAVLAGELTLRRAAQTGRELTSGRGAAGGRNNV